MSPEPIYSLKMPDKNLLYYGDNLEVLRLHVADTSVDLVYLDPPFNSNANYNVLFAEQDGTRSAGQIEAFTDTWRWDQVAVRDYSTTVEEGGRVADALVAMRTFLGPSNMLAYLSMMAPRLIQLRRVLKPTGSLYLHCDPTASHYLKILLDAVFGPENFRNEITWQRVTGHSDAKRWGNVADTILYYSKSDDVVWHTQYREYDAEYLETKYRYTEPDGRRYRLGDLNPPGGRGPIYEFHGLTRPWRFTEENMLALEREGRIYTQSKVPQFKRYLDTMPGAPIGSVWTDIDPINSRAAERLGYPTQKPVALLQRIIEASSNPGDLVLDPFCGCGTAVDAAQRLGRMWIGIDITHLSINLIKVRMRDAYGENLPFEIIGEPTDVEGAKDLALSDPYQFQWWALGLVGARPVEQKKGADRGIDGRLFFHDEEGGETKQVIFSVKAGHVTVSQLRDLRGVVEREGAAIGVLISMEESTKPMRTEAADAGLYSSSWGSKYPKLQLLTVGDLLDGRKIEMPELGSMAENVTNKRAPRVKTIEQKGLF